jgi:transposase
VRRTWAPKGKTPLTRSAGGWNNHSATGVITAAPQGKKPELFLRMLPQAVNRWSVIDMLKQLKRQIHGRVILIWDRLPAHRAKEVREFLTTQKAWLTTEYFPPYAPELDPVEYLWSSLKGKDVPNDCPDTMKELDEHVKKGARRIRRHPEILKGFLKKSELFKKTGVKVMGKGQ